MFFDIIALFLITTCLNSFFWYLMPKIDFKSLITIITFGLSSGLGGVTYAIATKEQSNYILMRFLVTILGYFAAYFYIRWLRFRNDLDYEIFPNIKRKHEDNFFNTEYLIDEPDYFFTTHSKDPIGRKK
jgi:hypothetical protein